MAVDHIKSLSRGEQGQLVLLLVNAILSIAVIALANNMRKALNDLKLQDNNVAAMINTVIAFAVMTLVLNAVTVFFTVTNKYTEHHHIFIGASIVLTLIMMSVALGAASSMKNQNNVFKPELKVGTTTYKLLDDVVPIKNLTIAVFVMTIAGFAAPMIFKSKSPAAETAAKFYYF